MEKIIFNNIEFYKLKDFGDYYVSKSGNVYSKKSKKILKPQLHRQGYLLLSLYNGKKFITKTIHRLVAQQFISNPNSKSQINHINGDKSDNKVENLEWCTNGENQKHAYKYLNKINCNKNKFGKLHHNSKKIKQLDLNGNLIKIWDSMSDINRELNLSKGRIYDACNKITKTSRGFIWEYL